MPVSLEAFPIPLILLAPAEFTALITAQGESQYPFKASLSSWWLSVKAEGLYFASSQHLLPITDSQD